MRSKQRRLEIALFQAGLVGPLGLAVAVGAISILIGVFIIVARPDPARFDPWRSAHAADQGVYCRTYGKGGTVCSEVPERVREFRERREAIPRKAN